VKFRHEQRVSGHLATVTMGLLVVSDARGNSLIVAVALTAAIGGVLAVLRSRPKGLTA
jgi:hypothetical protein